MKKLNLSLPDNDRILKVSLVISYLAESTEIKAEQIVEPNLYRNLNREAWGGWNYCLPLFKGGKIRIVY